MLRFDPFRELDRLSQQLIGWRTSVMPMDAYRRGDNYFIHLDLPGVDPSTIDVTVEKDVVTIAAERPSARHDDDRLLIAERPEGRFTRQLFLGDNLDLDRLEANYEHGVLTIKVPMAEQAKPRKIEISAGRPAQEALEQGRSEAEAPAEEPAEELVAA